MENKEFLEYQKNFYEIGDIIKLIKNNYIIEDCDNLENFEDIENRFETIFNKQKECIKNGKLTLKLKNDIVNFVDTYYLIIYNVFNKIRRKEYVNESKIEQKHSWNMNVGSVILLFCGFLFLIIGCSLCGGYEPNGGEIALIVLGVIGMLTGGFYLLCKYLG